MNAAGVEQAGAAGPGGPATAQTMEGVYRRLAEGTVHDARNALNAMALQLEVLNARLGSVEPAQKSLKALRTQVSRLDGILRRFLRFASPASEEGTVDLAELVLQAVEVCAHEARRQGVVVETEVVQSARVAGAVDRISEAVLATVLRGIDAGRGGRLRVEVGSQGEQAVVSLEENPGPASLHPLPEALTAEALESVAGRARGGFESGEGGEQLSLPLSEG